MEQLLLSCRALSSPTLCRFIPALSQRPINSPEYVPGTNQLQSATGDNALVFTHDASGNMTGMGDRTLVYNQKTRLIRVKEIFEILGEYVYNDL